MTIEPRIENEQQSRSTISHMAVFPAGSAAAAEKYRDDYVARWQPGYSGQADIWTRSNGEIVVACSRWASCD